MHCRRDMRASLKKVVVAEHVVCFRQTRVVLLQSDPLLFGTLS
jgi:hypothetical protein